MKKCIGVILARAASKRIPGKNIKKFLGYPVIKYSIDAARESGCFDEIMVSTDDREISKIARRCRAATPFLRSKKNSSDLATTADALKEVLLWYEKSGRVFDYCCCIYPAAPLVSPERIREGRRILEKKEADSVVPVTNFSYPVQRALRLSGGKLVMAHPENALLRTQDLEELFHDAAQFYWLNVRKFLKAKRLFTENTFAILLPAIEAQDIDNQEDWVIAEAKYRVLKSMKAKAAEKQI